MGGRIETATAAGQGTLQAGAAADHGGDAGGDAALRRGCTVAVPSSTLIEIVRRATPAEIQQAYESGLETARRPRDAVLLAGRAAAGVVPRRIENVGRTRPVVVVHRAAAWRCTSTKCWATRKWWSRTSGRSCRACRPGRHDAAGVRCRGADLQPGGAGHALYGDAARAATRQRDGTPVAPAAGAGVPPSRRSPQGRWCWWSTTRSPCAA